MSAVPPIASKFLCTAMKDAKCHDRTHAPQQIARRPADYAALNRANFLRRPALSLGAGAAHQHCPLTVAQAASLKEGLDGLLVVDDCERACPVRAPQAAVKTP